MNWVIIGNGVWARALGAVLNRNEQPKSVQYFARTLRQPDESSDSSILQKADVFIWGASTSALGQIILPHNKPILLACKGIQLVDKKLRLPSEWFPNNFTGVLSGPTFAHEVQKNLPAAMVLASQEEKVLDLADDIKNPYFRLYKNTDMKGVQIGGAVKNVVALAAGMCVGMGLGQNAVAALVTRGLAEIQRVGNFFGACSETFMGLSGMGDVMLTALSLDSRNTRLGYDLGCGMPLQDALAKAKGVVEGVKTVQSLHQLQEEGIYLPITSVLYKILFEGLPLPDGVHNILNNQHDDFETI